MTERARKTALVTGASGGIGRAIAQRLAGNGFRVAVHYACREDVAREVAAGLSGDGHAVLGADLAEAEVASGLIDAMARRFGHVDVLVNNAGIYVDHAPDRVDLDTWRAAWHKTLTVNLTAAADLAFCALPHFPSAGGKIINVSSRGAYRGEPEAPAYGASKAGMNSLTQSLARALGPRGICVYGVAPGWVDTEMAAAHLEGGHGEEIRAQSPLGRVARPEEVANVVAFLADDDTEYLSGAIIDVNGASYFR